MRGTCDEWLWEKETKSGEELVGNDKDGVADIGNCGVKGIIDSGRKIDGPSGRHRAHKLIHATLAGLSGSE